MKYILIGLFISFIFQGCASLGFYTRDQVTGERVPDDNAGITLPISKKKLKRKIHPTIVFINGLQEYHKEVHTFPTNLSAFRYYSKTTNEGMKSMLENGYKNMIISYWSSDSLRIKWTHPPVYTQKIGRTNFSFDATGTFIFTCKDSSLYSTTVLDR